MKTSNEVIDKIIELATEKNISITQLAKKVGMSKSGISLYFKKTREFPLNRTPDFAKALGVSPDFLINDDVTNIIIPNEIIKIPVLGQIACGEPITAEENISDYTEVPKNLLPSGEFIYLIAKGHSMEPKIPDGARVLIRLQPNIENDEIAAILVNNQTEATLKKVKKQGNTLVLFPLNPDYDVIIPNPDDEIKIIGKAVQVTLEI